MKSLLLLAAIAALIINQAYKKKAAVEYLSAAINEQESPDSQQTVYSPLASYVIFANNDWRTNPNAPLRHDNISVVNKGFINFSSISVIKQ